MLDIVTGYLNVYINNKYKYVVIKKKIIYENQYNELSQNEKEINLITCTLNNI